MRKEVRTATSADGTPIVFDRLGDGPPVIVVGGQFCDRVLTRPTAEELAKHFTVFNYDRRGRGDSGDTQPYAIEREIEDIGALIAGAGGTASVYAHSSGAGLALHAAAAGLPITRLVLHEPPYAPDSRGGTVPTDSTWAGRSQTPCLTGGTRSWRARNTSSLSRYSCPCWRSSSPDEPTRLTKEA